MIREEDIALLQRMKDRTEKMEEDLQDIYDRGGTEEELEKLHTVLTLMNQFNKGMVEFT